MLLRHQSHGSKRFHCDSESDSDWSPSKDSSSGSSPTPKKRRSSISPNTDSSTKKKNAAKRTKSSPTPGKKAVSRDIFRSKLPPGVTIKKELDISGLSSKWLLCQFCKRKCFTSTKTQIEKVHGDAYYEEDVRIESKVFLKELPRERKPYPCSYCGKNCHRADRVQAHERRCSKNTDKSARPKKCKNCSKTFSSSGFLQRHVEFCGKQEYTHTCQTCGKSFADESLFKIHQARHSGNKPFACQSCDRKFYKSNDLKKHERTHSGEKPYKCQHCDKHFARGDARNNHEKTHSSPPKPFKCDKCEKSFLQQSSLKFHMQKHDGEPPFNCEYCKESFTSKVKLKKHMEVHNLKKFKCSKCEESFFREDRLEKHVQKEHDKTEESAGGAEQIRGGIQNSNSPIAKDRVAKEHVAKTTEDATTKNGKGVAEENNKESVAGDNLKTSDQLSPATNTACEEAKESATDRDQNMQNSNIVSEGLHMLERSAADASEGEGKQDEGVTGVDCNTSVVTAPVEEETETDEDNVAKESVDQGNVDVSVDEGDNVDESVDQDRVDESVDQDRVDESVDQDRVDESIDQDRVDESIDQDRVDESVDQDRVDESVDQDHVDESVDQDHVDESVDRDHVESQDQDHVDDSVEQDHVDESGQDHESDQDHVDESVDQDHVFDESDRNLVDESLDQDRIVDDSDRDNVDELVDQDHVVDETVDQDASADEENENKGSDGTCDEFDMSVAEASSEEDEKEEPIDETSTSGSDDMSGLERMRRDGVLLKSKDKRTSRGARDMMPHEIVNVPNASYDNFDVPTEVLIDYGDQDPSSHIEGEECLGDECLGEECLACRAEHVSDKHDSDDECEECLACKNEMQPIVESKVMQYITSIAKGLTMDDKLRHELQLSSSEQTTDNDLDAEDDSSQVESCCTSTCASRIDESCKCACGIKTVVKAEVESDDDDDDDDDDDEADSEGEEENCEEGGTNCGETSNDVVKVEYNEASADCDETTVYNTENGDCDETNGNDEDSNGDNNGGGSGGDCNETNGDCDNQGSGGNNNEEDDDNNDKDECEDTNDEETGEEVEDEDEDGNDLNDGDETPSSKKDVDDHSSDTLNKIQNNNNTKDHPTDINKSSSLITSNMTTDVQADSHTDAVGVAGDADNYMEQFRETEVLQSLKELCENYEELSSEDEEMCSTSNIKSRDDIVGIIQKETQFLENFDKDSVGTDNSTDSEVVIMRKNVDYDVGDGMDENRTESSSLNNALVNGIDNEEKSDVTASETDNGAKSEVSTDNVVKKRGRPKGTGVSSLKSRNNMKRGRGRPKVVKVKACRYCNVTFEAEYLKSHKKVCAEKPSKKKRKDTMIGNGDVDSVESRTKSGTANQSNFVQSLPNSVAKLPNSVAKHTEQLKKRGRKRKAIVLQENSEGNNDEQKKGNSQKRKLSARDGESSGEEDHITPRLSSKRCSRSSLVTTCQYCRFRVQKSYRLKTHEVKCLEILKQFEYLDKHPEVVKESLKDGKKYRCHFCIKDCKSRQRFEQHWRLCQQRKIRIEQVKGGQEVDTGYNCRYCRQSFLDENVWVEHEMECRSLEEKYEEIMHTTPKQPVYECKKCGKVFERLFMWERHKSKCVRPRKAQRSSQGAKTPSTPSSVPGSPNPSQSNSRTLKRLAMDLEFEFTPANINSPTPSLRSTQHKPTSAASSPAKSNTSSPAKSPLVVKGAAKRKGRKEQRKPRSLDFKRRSSKHKQGGSAKSTPTSSPKKTSPSTPKKSALQLKSLQLKKKSLHQQQASMQMKRHSFRCRYCNEYCYNIEKLITHERKCLFLKDYSELPRQLRDHFGASFF
ncbi:uncharacterized protein [Amphiura filiformis]|uniref:uncharacterized protein n=1 Tax=Amphiura filiformis TaxID=82378 RepID=UPI003B20D281